jgi:hypothetical protein
MGHIRELRADNGNLYVFVTHATLGNTHVEILQRKPQMGVFVGRVENVEDFKRIWELIR